MEPERIQILKKNRNIREGPGQSPAGTGSALRFRQRGYSIRQGCGPNPGSYVFSADTYFFDFIICWAFRSVSSIRLFSASLFPSFMISKIS